MQTIIQLDNVTAGYDGQPEIKNISLTVADRDFIGIIGPNGGGKTTLIRVILGLLHPMTGSLHYYHNGTETKRIKMGYLPQYNAIDKSFPISVYDTILSGLNGDKPLFSRFTTEHHRQVARTIEKMQLGDFAQRPIKALSGGELQRVLMARAVVSQPEVLVLDEPNTYIDRHFKQQMYDMLGRFNRDCAIIMVSHDIDYIRQNAKSVAYVDEVLTLNPNI